MRESPETINLLISAADDFFNKVRARAIYSLGQFTNDPAVIRKLNEIIGDKTRTSEDRSRARLALNPKVMNTYSGQVDFGEIRRTLEQREAESKKAKPE
jgi:hypothetical protein